MNIIVCIKQVPDTTRVRTDSRTGTLIREAASARLNPDDRHAVELALRLRSGQGGTITALSLGPPQAEKALREVCALGVDEAILLSGRAFAGSDTWATASALALAIEKTGKPDIVLCGRCAADGETQQVGPQLAEALGFPQATAVLNAELTDDGKRLVVQKCFADERLTLELPLPCLLTVDRHANQPRHPHIGRIVKVHRELTIPVWTAADIGAPPATCGLEGSPTRVWREFKPEPRRAVEMISGVDPADQVQRLAARLRQALNLQPSVVANAQQDRPSTAVQLNAQSVRPDLTENREPRAVAVCVEQRRGQVSGVTLQLLGQARELADHLGTPLCALLAGKGVRPLAASLVAAGADEVMIVEHNALEDYATLPYTRALTAMVAAVRPEILLVAGTDCGRDLAPRVAQRLNTGLTADCTDLSIDPATGRLLQTKPAFGDSAMVTIVTPAHTPQMVTVRPGVIKASPPDPERTGKVTELTVDIPADDLVVAVLDRGINRNESIAIQDAAVIVAGGRGVGSAAGFAALRELAEVLGGEIAGSRAVVENGWLGEDRLVGQTGAMVHPRLYIACGISGAVQHLTGLGNADRVVAINSDPTAPIFAGADFGLVGDLHQIVPLLSAELKRHR